MRVNAKGVSLALLTSLAASALSPVAFAEGRQKNKNDWRNLAAAGATVAGYGLLKGDTTATVLGAAGAAYSAKRYEDERKSQSQAKAARARYHRTAGGANFYSHHGRKYYTYQRRLYYQDLTNGTRHLAE